MSSQQLARRTFVVGAAGTALAGCLSDGNGVTTENSQGDDGTDPDAGTFPTYELPVYGDWMPVEHHAGKDLILTHIDWATIAALDAEDDHEEPDDEELIERVPIVGLPIYGGIVSGLALITLFGYPFTEEILENDTESGIDAQRITWSAELVIMHGDFDPEVFDEEYSDGFEAGEEVNDFTTYEASDRAYAVSEDILVVAVPPGEDDDYDPPTVVADALERYTAETDRVVDEEDGQWLFETTGDARLGFAAWDVDDLLEALDPTDEERDDFAEPEEADSPVFDDVERVANIVTFEVDDGEPRDFEARFSGVYPEDAVPSEDRIREDLIGETALEHDIVIEDTRVHAWARFDDILE